MCKFLKKVDQHWSSLLLKTSMYRNTGFQNCNIEAFLFFLVGPSIAVVVVVTFIFSSVKKKQSKHIINKEENKKSKLERRPRSDRLRSSSQAATRD